MSEEFNFEEDFLAFEKNKDLVKEFKEVTTPKQAEAPKELTASEKEAMEQGWRPKEEFDPEKTGKRFVGADEYLDRKSFFDKIAAQKKEIEQARHQAQSVQKELERVRESVKRVEERSYQKALEDLNAQREAAVTENRVQDWHTIEAKMVKVHQEMADLNKPVVVEETKAEATPFTPTTEQSEFLERNRAWFTPNSYENNKMINRSLEIEQFLHQRRPDLSEGQRLQIIEEDIRKEFPHRFENPKREESSPVTTDSDRALAGSKQSLSSLLDDEQKEMGKKMINQGAYSNLDEYAKDLIKYGVVKPKRN